MIPQADSNFALAKPAEGRGQSLACLLTSNMQSKGDRYKHTGSATSILVTSLFPCRWEHDKAELMYAKHKQKTFNWTKLLYARPSPGQKQGQAQTQQPAPGTLGQLPQQPEPSSAPMLKPPWGTQHCPFAGTCKYNQFSTQSWVDNASKALLGCCRTESTSRLSSLVWGAYLSEPWCCQCLESNKVLLTKLVMKMLGLAWLLTSREPIRPCNRAPTAHVEVLFQVCSPQSLYSKGKVLTYTSIASKLKFLTVSCLPLSSPFVLGVSIQ